LIALVESAQPSAGGSLRAELAGLGEFVEAGTVPRRNHEVLTAAVNAGNLGVGGIGGVGSDEVRRDAQLKALWRADTVVGFGPVQDAGKVCGMTPD